MGAGRFIAMSRISRTKLKELYKKAGGPKYIIRLGDGGYFGAKPYTGMDRKDAHVFPSMKLARRQLNRLNGRLMKEGGAEIEPL